MATAMGYQRYTFPVLASLSDNTSTALTGITIEIPERVVTFHKVKARLTADDIITATGGTIASRSISIGLGGGTKTTVTNNNALTNSGENMSFDWTADLTSRFTSSWSGTSMTCECDVLVDQNTGTTLGMVNVIVTLDIVYEYNISSYDITGVAATDVLTSKSGGSPVAHGLAVGALVRIKNMVGGSGATDGVYSVATVPTSSTFTLTGFAFSTDITAGTVYLSPRRSKTARIPLSMPAGALATSKPSSLHTIPALDTEFPEASKTFVQMTIEMNAVTAVNAVTTDHTVSFELDSLGAHTTGNYEAALATDRQVRYCVSPSYFSGLDTSTSHSYYAWGSVARFNHAAVCLLVTYSYDEDSTTNMWVDVTLLCNSEKNMAGGGGGSPPSVMAVDLFIPEQSPTTKGIAFCWQVGTNSTISALNARLGKGSYTTYTDAVSVNASGCIGQTVNNSAYTLNRGRNRLEFSIYHSGGDDSLGLTGWFHVAYTCAKPSAGTQAANKTIPYATCTTGTSAMAKNCGAVGPVFAIIPESTNWFLQNWGLQICITSPSAGPTGLFGSGVMTTGDIGNRAMGPWHRNTDSEIGYQFLALAPIRGKFVWPWANYWKGNPKDSDSPGDPTQGGSLFVTFANGATATAQGAFDVLYTYHTISFDVTGDISGSNGGLVKVNVFRNQHFDCGVTGTASTDLFTTVGNKTHQLSVGDSVKIFDVTGGAGVTWNAWFTVATVPSPSTFTLTGANFTTDISAATARFPLPDGCEKIGQTERTGDGSYSFVWYDDVEPLYTEAYEDDNYLGRSAPALAGT